MGNKIRCLIVSAMASVAFCASAPADIVVDHQPHPFGGPASDTSFLLFPNFPYSQRVADDFVLSNSEQLVSLTWWGFYNEDNPPVSETMRVRIYGARGDGLPDEGNLVSESMLQNPSRTATGRIIITGHNPHEYRYEAALSTSAILDANTKYWLEVVQIGDLTTMFRWEDSVAELDEHAFKNSQVGDWALTSNGPDLAFQVITPEPYCLGAMLAGIAFLSRNREGARRKMNKRKTE